MLGGLYLIGALTAVASLFQLRTGSPDLAAWWTSNAVMPAGFLVSGIVYGTIGSIAVGAATVLRLPSSRHLLLASLAIVLVALDALADLFRKNLKNTVDSVDVAGTALTGILLLVTVVCLMVTRRRIDQTGAA
jgi:hypothetical protein